MASPPDRCLVIEDSVAGIEAGRRGGIKCLAVTTTNLRALNIHPKMVWVPLILLVCALVLLLSYAISYRLELVVHTSSGTNCIRLSLSKGMSDSVEQFVTAIESRIQGV